MLGCKSIVLRSWCVAILHQDSDSQGSVKGSKGSQGSSRSKIACHDMQATTFCIYKPVCTSKIVSATR
jgi:hypothetical protein